MSHSHRSSFALYALVMLAGHLTGCTANPNRFTEQFEHKARSAGLVRHVVPGTTFSHIVYARTTVLSDDTAAANPVVLVYLEGDGVPSIDRRQPSSDPTPRHALALELLIQTRAPTWYLTRPCYNSMAGDPGCNGSLWTSARYSTTVVESMVAALTRHAQSHGNPRLVLVGYSGGGVLAVLMASRMSNVIGVITLAANLDVEGWAAALNYTPLVDSLNPVATQSLAIPEIHFAGGRDTTVPVTSVARYFTAHPQALLWQYPDYDHRCCWEKNWPTLLDRALRQLLP